MIRSIVLISVDDLRFDAMSCAGDLRYLERTGLAGMRQTKTIDSLAARGVVFANAFTTCPYTPSAHASMLTGHYPPAHGVRAFMTNQLPAGVRTLPETLRAAGFRTIASIDMAPMFSLLGLTRGFEQVVHLDDRALFESLAKMRDERVFLFAHFEDVHPPVLESLAPPSDGYNDDFYAELPRVANAFEIEDESVRDGEWTATPDHDLAIALSGKIRRFLESRRIVAAAELPRYLAGVGKFDSGRFADFLAGIEATIGLAESLVILTSDHGQGTIPSHRMADPGIPQKFDHGEAVLDEVIRVPLIVAGAGSGAGTECSETVSLADVAPAILELAGVEPPGPADGRSFVPALFGERIGPSAAYAEVWYHDRAELSRYLKDSMNAGQLLPGGYSTFMHERTVREGSLKFVAGQSIQPGEAPLVERETRDGSRSRTEVLEQFLKRHPVEALYDVDRDPFEEVDLLSQAKVLSAYGIETDAPLMASRLRSVLESLSTEGSAAGTGTEPTANAVSSPGEVAEVESRLRDLGYID